MGARGSKLAFALLAMASLGACGSHPLTPAAPPPPAIAAPPPMPATPADPAATCLAALDARGIVYQRQADFHTPEGCGIDWSVRVDRSAIPWNRPALMSCPFAATEWDFETRVVQPQAQKLLRHRVAMLTHLGTYACRGERGGVAERLSQHAFGRAIDVSGFTLDDGTKITLLRDWSDKGAKGRFLHAVARAACGIFQVVITPDNNSFHADHLHLDTGPYKWCGPDQVKAR